MTDQHEDRTIHRGDIEAAIAFIDGFVRLFDWRGSMTPSEYLEIISTFPGWVQQTVEEICDERGFPNAIDDHEWEYMRATGEIALDVIGRLRAALS